jgi:hypothetical protein
MVIKNGNKITILVYFGQKLKLFRLFLFTFLFYKVYKMIIHLKIEESSRKLLKKIFLIGLGQLTDMIRIKNV